MGLIIKNKIAQLMKGYPTVSDKYNVQGGIFEKTEDNEVLHFGDLVAYGSATGHYTVLEDGTIANLAGICLATNVKLANRYPGDSNAKVETLPGEAFNLLVRGFVAVAIEDATFDAAVEAYNEVMEDAEATAAEKAEAIETFEAAKKAALALTTIKEGQPVYLAADGKFATAGTAVPGAYFMGVAEIINNELVAEINYKM